MTSTRIEHLDVVIIGAGISGIGAAYYLKRDHPGRSVAILEARGALGGTWDLFRYPGIRSDSDLHTFGYEFKPWRDDAIASGDKILAYLREAAAEHGIDDTIRFHHEVVAAHWSSEDARWLITVNRSDTGEQIQLSTNWIFCASGYYRYDEGFTPAFAGRDRFGGTIVHPQHWPEDLDYAGKRVVVIGSGATAVTLLPAMADTAGHVTMLQRSPTYILPMPSRDVVAEALTGLLGERRGFAATRRKNIAQQRFIFRFSRRFPTLARKLLRALNAAQLPKDYPVDVHFNPSYAPWDQRMCAVPDADLFKAISSGKASVVTDRIATFTETGIALESGEHLEADIIVTATGLNMLPLAGIPLTVDDRAVSVPDTIAYRGMMLTDVPNFAFAVGYTTSSWTLKVGLLCQQFCRLLTHMDVHGYDTVYPHNTDADMPTRPLLDFAAGYVQRSIGALPRQGASDPWLMSTDYREDVKLLDHQLGTDTHLRFADSTTATAGAGTTAAALA